MEPDQTIITAKDLKIALRRAKGNSKELIEAEIDDNIQKSNGSTRANTSGQALGAYANRRARP